VKNGISCRQAILADLDQLVALRWAFQTESDDGHPNLPPSLFMEECRTFLADGLQSGRWSFWIAEDEEGIVSHAFVQKISMVPNPNRISDQWGYLTNCYTKPEYRSQGIGSVLMEALIQWARLIDLELLIVWPSDESLDYYKRLGFSEQNKILQMSLRSVGS
jgi:GNAT superfamily N-acetyltransferase